MVLDEKYLGFFARKINLILCVILFQIANSNLASAISNTNSTRCQVKMIKYVCEANAALYRYGYVTYRIKFGIAVIKDSSKTTRLFLLYRLFLLSIAKAVSVISNFTLICKKFLGTLPPSQGRHRRTDPTAQRDFKCDLLASIAN